MARLSARGQSDVAARDRVEVEGDLERLVRVGARGLDGVLRAAAHQSGGEARGHAGGRVRIVGGVGARAAEENVVARAAAEQVVARAAREHVVAAIADQHVVAGAAGERVGVVRAADRVVVLRACRVFDPVEIVANGPAASGAVAAVVVDGQVERDALLRVAVVDRIDAASAAEVVRAPAAIVAGEQEVVAARRAEAHVAAGRAAVENVVVARAVEALDIRKVVAASAAGFNPTSVDAHVNAVGRVRIVVVVVAVAAVELVVVEAAGVMEDVVAVVPIRPFVAAVAGCEDVVSVAAFRTLDL